MAGRLIDPTTCLQLLSVPYATTLQANFSTFLYAIPFLLGVNKEVFNTIEVFGDLMQN